MHLRGRLAGKSSAAGESNDSADQAVTHTDSHLYMLIPGLPPAVA